MSEVVNELAVVVGGVEVDVKSMSRSQTLELARLRKAVKQDGDNEKVVQEANDYVVYVLKDLYPQLEENFDEYPNRDLMLLTTVTEQFSAAVPVKVIESLLKNA